VDTDLLDLPGPRLVEGLEQVARLLHPEAFAE
jgi:ABC-type Fe3+-hydroxamate transport system substrate-binding protein